MKLLHGSLCSLVVSAINQIGRRLAFACLEPMASESTANGTSAETGRPTNSLEETPSMMNHPALRACGRALLGALTVMSLTGTVLAHPFRVDDMQNLSRV